MFKLKFDNLTKLHKYSSLPSQLICVRRSSSRVAKPMVHYTSLPSQLICVWLSLKLGFGPNQVKTIKPRLFILGQASWLFKATPRILGIFFCFWFPVPFFIYTRKIPLEYRIFFFYNRISEPVCAHLD